MADLAVMPFDRPYVKILCWKQLHRCVCYRRRVIGDRIFNFYRARKWIHPNTNASAAT